MLVLRKCRAAPDDLWEMDPRRHNGAACFRQEFVPDSSTTPAVGSQAPAGTLPRVPRSLSPLGSGSPRRAPRLENLSGTQGDFSEPSPIRPGILFAALMAMEVSP